MSSANLWTILDIAASIVLSLLLLIVVYKQYKLDHWSKEPIPHVQRIRQYEEEKPNELLLEVSNIGEGPAENLKLLANLTIEQSNSDTSQSEFQPKPHALNLERADIQDSAWVGVKRTNLPPRQASTEFIIQLTIDLYGNDEPRPFNEVLNLLTDTVRVARLKLTLVYDQLGDEYSNRIPIVDYVIFPEEAESLSEAITTGADYSSYQADREATRMDAAVELQENPD